jgi:hypothetical protein
MPAVAIVASIVVSDVVGAAVAEAVGSAIVGSIVGGAAGGAVGSAISGGDIGKGILTGAVGGGVGGAAGQAAQAAGASPELTRAASTFAGGTARGVASGADFGTAVKGGLVGAGLSYAGDELFGAPPGRDASLGDKLIAGGERALLNKAVSSLFEPSRSGVGATSYSPTLSTPQTQTQTGGPSASTAALSQALRTGDPGAPLFGTEGKEGQRKNVWNTASLKLKDETGT